MKSSKFCIYIVIALIFGFCQNSLCFAASDPCYIPRKAFNDAFKAKQKAQTNFRKAHVRLTTAAFKRRSAVNKAMRQLNDSEGKLTGILLRTGLSTLAGPISKLSCGSSTYLQKLCDSGRPGRNRVTKLVQSYFASLGTRNSRIRKLQSQEKMQLAAVTRVQRRTIESWRTYVGAINKERQAEERMHACRSVVFSLPADCPDTENIARNLEDAGTLPVYCPVAPKLPSSFSVTVGCFDLGIFGVRFCA